MLTAITYNCNPESLDEVPQEAFVDAFENEARAADYNNAAVTVTFCSGKSGVTSVTVDDDDYPDPANWNDEFANLAERAFRACCK